MYMSEPAREYGCRWAWCRLIFSDSDALTNHVIHDHVRCAIPVRRKDIPMLRRAEEGLGESLKLSDIMRDPSSSMSQNIQSDQSKDSFESQPLLPSSSLPSPPASSLVSPSEDRNHHAEITDMNPTFASLSSPSGSLSSLKIPVSPTFSMLVRRTNKRKEPSSEAFEDSDNKRLKQAPLSQESDSSASSGSQRSVEGHLTQTSPSNHDHGSEDENSDADAHEVNQSSLEDVTMAPPTSSTPFETPIFFLEGSQQDVYPVGLNWDISQGSSLRLASQSSSIGQEAGKTMALDSLSQPPSQLQLNAPIYHVHKPKPSSSQPQQIQTNPDSSLSLPISPILLPSAVGFAVSTPQRQTWYQPPPRRTFSGSRPSSKENTPKPIRPQELPTVTTTTMNEDESQTHILSEFKGQAQRPIALSPLNKKSVFRSGTLQVTHPFSTSLPRHSRSASQTQPPPSPLPKSAPMPNDLPEGNTDTIPVLLQEVFTMPDDSWAPQSQLESMSQDFPYPPLQTQAPYQSQSLSQLD